MHSLIENQEVEKQRESQENLGELLKKRDLKYESFEIDEISAEWVSVDRAHMKKYVILYCHGGGYMTGSYRYARSITNKLASSTSMDVLSFDYRLPCNLPRDIERELPQTTVQINTSQKEQKM